MREHDDFGVPIQHTGQRIAQFVPTACEGHPDVQRHFSVGRENSRNPCKGPHPQGQILCVHVLNEVSQHKRAALFVEKDDLSVNLTSLDNELV